MSKFELIKTIEARKLNKRTRLSVGGPPVTIPYAAILDQVTREREDVTFVYLLELYECPYNVFAEAARPLDAEAPEAAPAPASVPDAPPQVSAAAETEQAAPGDVLQWEDLPSSRYPMARAKVPGGWLVSLQHGAASALTFYPDPDHRWTGGPS